MSNLAHALDTQSPPTPDADVSAAKDALLYFAKLDNLLVVEWSRVFWENEERAEHERAFDFGDYPDPADSDESDPNADWPTPIPLGEEIALPTFPVQTLPPVIRAWVEAYAVALQLPPDIPAALALGAIAAASAGRFKVEPRQGWTEPLNLYVVGIASSADRKSAAAKAAVRVLQDREDVQKAAYWSEVGELKRALKSATDDDEAAAELQEQLDVMFRDGPPRMLADDVTPERMAGLMHTNDGRLAIISPEGVGFVEGLSRYGASANIELVLKAHPGERINVDRQKDKEALTIKAPTLTLVLACQPNIIDLLIQNTSFYTRGLPQRFLYFWPKSKVGHRETAPPPVPAAVIAAYDDTIGKLLDLPAPTLRGLSARDAATTSLEPRTLSFTPEAQALLIDFAEELEPRLVAFGDSTDSWGGKLEGAIARIAGLLCLVRSVSEHSENCEVIPSRVSAADVASAIEIGRYLIPHAKRAFSLQDADPTVAAAKRIIQYIRSNSAIFRSSFSKRDVHQGLRGDKRFARASDLDAPLELLEEKGWIRPRLVVEDGGRKGRKASPGYVAHAAVWPHNAHNPQN